MRNVCIWAVLGLAAGGTGLACAEELHLTTYYPAPYGSYRQMQVQRMAVGDTNGNGVLNANDQPGADGQIYAARSVILAPQSSLPADDIKEGEIVYNDADNTFYGYNGAGWQRMGGGWHHSGELVYEGAGLYWKEIDLSGIVGAGRRLVFLKVMGENMNVSVSVRPKGEPPEEWGAAIIVGWTLWNHAGGTCGVEGWVGSAYTLLIETDAEGKIEVMHADGTFRIWLMGWI